MESNIRTCVRLQYFGNKEMKIKLDKYFISKEVEKKLILKKQSKPLVISLRLEILFVFLKHEFNLVSPKGI